MIDIAVPPAGQPAILHAALEHKHIRGILAQKPLATNYRDAQEMVAACERAGIKLCVNQNMRYDHSIRALKTLLRRGDLGEPVLATIDMRAIPHWQPWLQENTAGDAGLHEHPSPGLLPLTCSAIPSSSTSARASGSSHRLSPPRRHRALHPGVRQRHARVGVGRYMDRPLARRRRCRHLHQVARGRHGGHGAGHHRLAGISRARAQHHPLHHQAGTRLLVRAPLAAKSGSPTPSRAPWDELLCSLEEGRESVLSGRDNLNTLALVEACYRSLDQHRPVRPALSREQIRGGRPLHDRAQLP